MRTNGGRRASRRILSMLSLSAVVAGMVGITASTASAATCQAKDGVVSSSNLQAVIDGASTGDTILITGTCVGNFVIPGGGSATNLTLVGQRRAVSSNTLDGNGTGSVLEVDTGTTVTLKNLRITNGSRPQGAGIYNDHGVVHVVGRTRVLGNTATGDGGGIFNSVGYIYLSGKAQVRGNTASTGYGGGLYNNFGTITMSGKALVTGNTAGISGGGIYNDGGTLVGATAGVNVKLNNPNDIAP